MDEMHVLDFGDGKLINLYWMTHTNSRKIVSEETGDVTYEVTFFFADGRGSQARTRLDQKGLDTISEAVV